MKLKRLIIDIDENSHAEIKAMCAFKNITIRKYVLRAVLKKLNEDQKYMQPKKEQNV